MLVRARSNIHRPILNLIDWTWRRCERGRICSYLIGDEDFIFGKKVIPFFRARAAAPVATTTLGLRGCACARPKEVVVWYMVVSLGLPEPGLGFS